MKLGFDPTQHKLIRYQSSQDPPKQIPKPKYIHKDIYVKSVNDKKTFNISWMVIGVNQSIRKSHLYPLYHPSPPPSPPLSLSLWNQSPKSNEDHDCPSICMWDMFVNLDLQERVRESFWNFWIGVSVKKRERGEIERA